MKRKTRSLLLGAASHALLLLLSAGCGPAYHVETPKSFRRFEQSADFRWITPEGVVLRGREVKNEPRAELPFWADTTRHHLKRKGYRLQKERDFQSAAGTAGKRLAFLVPRGGEDWLFTVALMVEGERVLLIETGGPWAQMHPLDAEIDGTLKSFRPAPK